MWYFHKSEPLSVRGSELCIHLYILIAFYYENAQAADNVREICCDMVFMQLLRVWVKQTSDSRSPEVARCYYVLCVDCRVVGVGFNEVTAGAYIFAHEHREDAVGLGNVINGDLFQHTALG